MLKRVWESSHKLTSSTSLEICNCNSCNSKQCNLSYRLTYLCTIRHAAVLVLPSPYLSREQLIRRQARMRRRELYEEAKQIAQMEETKRVNEQNKYHGKLHWCRSFSDEWELQTSSMYLSQLLTPQHELTSTKAEENEKEQQEEEKNIKNNLQCAPHSHQPMEERELEQMMQIIKEYECNAVCRADLKEWLCTLYERTYNTLLSAVSYLVHSSAHANNSRETLQKRKTLLHLIVIIITDKALKQIEWCQTEKLESRQYHKYHHEDCNELTTEALAYLIELLTKWENLNNYNIYSSSNLSFLPCVDIMVSLAPLLCLIYRYRSKLQLYYRSILKYLVIVSSQIDKRKSQKDSKENSKFYEENDVESITALQQYLLNYFVHALVHHHHYRQHEKVKENIMTNNKYEQYEWNAEQDLLYACWNYLNKETKHTLLANSIYEETIEPRFKQHDDNQHNQLQHYDNLMSKQEMEMQPFCTFTNIEHIAHRNAPVTLSTQSYTDKHYYTLLRQYATQTKADVIHKCMQLWECIYINKSNEREMVTTTLQRGKTEQIESEYLAKNLYESEDNWDCISVNNLLEVRRLLERYSKLTKYSRVSTKQKRINMQYEKGDTNAVLETKSYIHNAIMQLRTMHEIIEIEHELSRYKVREFAHVLLNKFFMVLTSELHYIRCTSTELQCNTNSQKHENNVIVALFIRLVSLCPFVARVLAQFVNFLDNCALVSCSVDSNKATIVKVDRQKNANHESKHLIDSMMHSLTHKWPSRVIVEFLTILLSERKLSHVQFESASLSFIISLLAKQENFLDVDADKISQMLLRLIDEEEKKEATALLWNNLCCNHSVDDWNTVNSNLSCCNSNSIRRTNVKYNKQTSLLEELRFFAIHHCNSKYNMNDCCKGTCDNGTCTNTTSETHLQHQLLHQYDGDSDNTKTLKTTKSVIQTASEVEYLQLIQAEMNNLSSQLTVLDKLATLQGRLLCISAQRQHLVECSEAE